MIAQGYFHALVHFIFCINFGWWPAMLSGHPRSGHSAALVPGREPRSTGSATGGLSVQGKKNSCRMRTPRSSMPLSCSARPSRRRTVRSLVARRPQAPVLPRALRPRARARSGCAVAATCASAAMPCASHAPRRHGRQLERRSDGAFGLTRPTCRRRCRYLLQQLHQQQRPQQQQRKNAPLLLAASSAVPQRPPNRPPADGPTSGPSAVG